MLRRYHPVMLGPRAFSDLHALARRVSRRAEEADDLVQHALLTALEAGRTNLASPETHRWLAGVIRNRAAFDARTAARRRKRETGWSEAQPALAIRAETPAPELAHLSPALRVTALLALSGHTRQEIGWLLNLSDTALRQRISQLKRALDTAPETGPANSLIGPLAFGRIRRALLGPTRRPEAFLASHDPDGHLFVVSRSQISTPRQQTRV
ncbi:MAG: transcriptional regulator [Sphingomonadales bacterium]|nr:MAG: transcriptional regulator [Sphingomonadales bacterium]